MNETFPIKIASIGRGSRCRPRDLFPRFGALGAARGRPRAEFVPWSLGAGDEGLMRWSVSATPFSWRERGRARRDRRSVPYFTTPLPPGGEEGVRQIEALAGVRTLHADVDLPKTGAMPAEPRGRVVENHADFSRDWLVHTRPVARPTDDAWRMFTAMLRHLCGWKIP